MADETASSGLPNWIRDLRSIFAAYGKQVLELTETKFALEAAIATVGQEIIDRLPEEIGKGGDETVVECACRLIRDYAEMRAQHEPMVARLAALEARLAPIPEQVAEDPEPIV